MAYTIGAKPRQQKTLKFLALLAATALGTAVLGACTPTETVRGDMLQDYQLATVQVGSDTQADVVREIGSPTTVAPFDDKTWYYIGQDTKKYGPLDPKIVKERVIRVVFDDQGKVAEVRDVTHLRDPVPYSRDKTPTSGNQITLPQQLLGNLGKFNNAAEGSKKVGSDQGGGNGR